MEYLTDVVKYLLRFRLIYFYQLMKLFIHKNQVLNLIEPNYKFIFFFKPAYLLKFTQALSSIGSNGLYASSIENFLRKRIKLD